jgi:hypothetical protein
LIDLLAAIVRLRNPRRRFLDRVGLNLLLFDLPGDAGGRSQLDRSLYHPGAVDPPGPVG